MNWLTEAIHIWLIWPWLVKMVERRFGNSHISDSWKLSVSLTTARWQFGDRLELFGHSFEKASLHRLLLMLLAITLAKALNWRVCCALAMFGFDTHQWNWFFCVSVCENLNFTPGLAMRWWPPEGSRRHITPTLTARSTFSHLGNWDFVVSFSSTLF